MAKNHKKTTIKIDGAKLKKLLENTTGKTVYQISEENGFSNNLIMSSVRSGYASAVVQNVAKLYGINPEAYKIEEPEPTKRGQMSFDDIESIKRSELLELIKDALRQVIREELK